MVGEISPDMMFFGFCQKCSELSSDGCGSVRMGAIGCAVMGRSKNKAKRGTNGRKGHVLQCMVKGRKKEELDNEGNGGQEASWGRIMGQQWMFGAARDM